MPNRRSNPKKTKKLAGDKLDIAGDVSRSVIIAGNGNVVNVGGKDSKSKSHNGKSARKATIPIVVALIGLFGTIVAALLTSPALNTGIRHGNELNFPPTKLSTSTPDPSDYPDAFGVLMRFVPKGEFMMGSNNGDSDEKPVHRVYLNDFYIDKYEVTNSLYKICVDTGVCKPPISTNSETHSSYYGNPSFDNYPVINVDWNMAKVYCESRKARLPTEAEWEKAARDTDGRTYPWGDGIDKTYANFGQNLGDTTPVGSYEIGKSVYGVYDMAGNVWEWVSDWYEDNYYSILTDNALNPLGPPSGQFKVLRGGSWYSASNDVRTTSRWNDPLYTGTRVGFRCARSTP